MNEHDDMRPLTLADVVPAGSGTPEEAIAGRGFTLYESALLGGAMREPMEIERPHRHPRHHEPPPEVTPLRHDERALITQDALSAPVGLPSGAPGVPNRLRLQAAALPTP